jgi:hypothetical protein
MHRDLPCLASASNGGGGQHFIVQGNRGRARGEQTLGVHGTVEQAPAARSAGEADGWAGPPVVVPLFIFSNYFSN